jgi:hypothetical protein
LNNVVVSTIVLPFWLVNKWLLFRL